MNRRLLSLFLCVLLVFSFSARAFADYGWDDDDYDVYDDDFDEDWYELENSYDAEEYYEMIGDILSSMGSVNQTCTGGTQMQANGIYRLVEMLALIAARVSQSDDTTDEIKDILDEWDRKNDVAGTATEQVINGAYRCFDLLSLIAWEMDEDENYSADISKASDDFAIGNNTSLNADQLLASALYSDADLLNIIALENSTSSSRSYKVNDTLEFMYNTDRGLNSEISRQLNAANCMFAFLNHICQELDKTDSRDWTNTARDLYNENSEFSKGLTNIDERIAYMLQSCVEMASIFAYELA